MSHEEREHRSAPVLTKERVEEIRSEASEWSQKYPSMYECEALAIEWLAMTSEVAVLRADRDRYHDERNEALSLNDYCAQTMRDLHEGFLKMRAERDAALAEVARLKALVIDCIPFIGYQACVDDLKARAYEAVDYDAHCKAHYASKEVQP